MQINIDEIRDIMSTVVNSAITGVKSSINEVRDEVVRVKMSLVKMETTIEERNKSRTAEINALFKKVAEVEDHKTMCPKQDVNNIKTDLKRIYGIIVLAAASVGGLMITIIITMWTNNVNH